MNRTGSFGEHDHDWRKSIVIAICCMCFLLTVLIALELVVVYKLYLGHKPNNPEVRKLTNDVSYGYGYYDKQAMPIVRINLIFFSSSINNLSSSLNKLIEDKNLNIPPAKFYDSSLSYRNSTGWILVTKDSTVFFLYDDVSSKLTVEEVRAVCLHELGHIVLGHIHIKKADFLRDIEIEKEADRLALAWGADQENLISAIAKLSTDKEESGYRRIAIN